MGRILEEKGACCDRETEVVSESGCVRPVRCTVLRVKEQNVYVDVSVPGWFHQCWKLPWSHVLIARVTGRVREGLF